MVSLFFAVARDLTHLRGRLARRTRTHMRREINPTRLALADQDLYRPQRAIPSVGEGGALEKGTRGRFQG